MLKFLILPFIFLTTTQVAFSAQQSIVDRQMELTDLPCRSFFEFHFCGYNRHLRALERWLSPVLETEIGPEVFDEMAQSRHKFLFIHSERATVTAGLTVSALTTKLSNGEGTDAVILMNFEMPDSGSHIVSAVGTQDLIEFTADQNLFHELSHAKHTLNGTMATMQEIQAIIEENIYREQIAKLKGREDYHLRNYRTSERDQQVWFGNQSDLLHLSSH